MSLYQIIINNSIIILKLLIGLSTITLSLMLFKSKIIFNISNNQFIIYSTATILFIRLIFYIFTYSIFNIDVTSDIPTYYVPQGYSVLSGKMVYKDFYSSYGPGFSYIVALILSAWDSPKAIVLFTLMTEVISMPFWILAARGMFSEDNVRRAFILYTSNSLPLVISSLAGQNQLWISLMLAISWFCIVKNKDLLSGLFIGFAIIFVKFLAIIYAPMLWIVSSKKRNWAIGFLIPMSIYIFFIYNKVNIFLPVQGEINNISSGNIPYFLALLGFNPFASYSTLILIISLVIMYILTNLLIKRNFIAAWFLTVVISLLFMLLSKKSPTNYLSIFIFMLSATIASKDLFCRKIILFGLFGMILIIEPSIWFRWFSVKPYIFDQYIMFNVKFITLKECIFLSIEFILLYFYSYYLYLNLKYLKFLSKI